MISIQSIQTPTNTHSHYTCTVNTYSHSYYIHYTYARTHSYMPCMPQTCTTHIHRHTPHIPHTCIALMHTCITHKYVLQMGIMYMSRYHTYYTHAYFSIPHRWTICICITHITYMPYHTHVHPHALTHMSRWKPFILLDWWVNNCPLVLVLSSGLPGICF